MNYSELQPNRTGQVERKPAMPDFYAVHEKR